ncbi:MAG: alpha-galactosidase, partial [Actinomycetota bacterium]
YSNLWRISDDFWDRWQDIKKQFEYARNWQKNTGANGWADADMLPLGRIGIRAERGKDRQTRFTKDEQITLMTLWSIFRSPLMFGGDLPSNDAWTLSLITGKEVLSINQNSTNNRELFNRGNQVGWIADVPKSKDKYVALFNLNDSTVEEIKVGCRETGLPTANCKVRDLWQGKDLGVFQNDIAAKVNSHGAVLYRVAPSR